MTRISITVNGTRHEVDVEPRQLLVYFLRDQLGLKGTNVGCDTSSCGSCTVLLDGESVKSCTVLAVQADGREVTTIEGLAAGDELHPVQQAFHEQHALQCGYCTPGFVMAAGLAPAGEPEPLRGRDPPRARGQPLPLHRVPQHRPGRAGRGGGLASGTMPVVALLGLGEAGGRLAADLAAAGAEVRGYDPDTGVEADVTRARDAQAAVAGSDLVLSVNSAAAAAEAAAAALARAGGAIYADLNTRRRRSSESSPGSWERGSPTWRCSDRFPRQACSTPALASGPAAHAFADAFGPLGMPVEVVSDRAGRRGDAEAPALGVHEGPRRLGAGEPRTPPRPRAAGSGSSTRSPR